MRLLALMILLAANAFGQRHCRDGYGTPERPLTREVATAPTKPVFAPTGWRTVVLDHITFLTPDYRKEAGFYIALMGWTLHRDDGKEAVLDIDDWGSVVFRQAPNLRAAAVGTVCWVIEPWNGATVERELRARGLTPIADNDGKGFESFHVKDPNGFDLQIGNSNGLVGQSVFSLGTAEISRLLCRKLPGVCRVYDHAELRQGSQFTPWFILPSASLNSVRVPDS